jgi:rhodanese-related sulfurtransferase
MLLDMRPNDEYSLDHLPGALNIPLRELEQRLSELPSGQEIVAYCAVGRIAFCRSRPSPGFAHVASRWRFEEGSPEWKAADLPVEVAA